MPDLLSHTLTAAISLKKPAKNAGFVKAFFFLAGNLLPDIFSRAPMILMPEKTPFFYPYHSITGAVLLSYLCSLFFEKSIRKNTFIYLNAGSVFHLVTDLIQKDIFNTGYQLFYPLPFRINIGFIWPEDCIYALPFLIAAALYIYWRELKVYFRKKV